MAAREFHGRITNQHDAPIVWVKDDCDGGQWTDPWYPSRMAGRIEPGQDGEWRSESDGIMTGTSGWALWGVRVQEITSFDRPADDHFEYVQVNWGIPFYGEPNVTFAVFPSDPRQAGSPDQRPPTLEIIGTLLRNDGSEGALAQAAEIAPYVLAIPWSFFAGGSYNLTHPRVHFTVRKRASTQAPSRLTFPASVPGPQQMAMQSFRHRAEHAPRAGFAAAFPNFYEATYGRDHVAGTLLIRPAAVEWRNVPLSELGNVPLDDFAARMRAVNVYAQQNGFAGAFPTYFHADYGQGIVCGVVLLKSDCAEYRDVPLTELGDTPLDNFGARFRATHDYATNQMFVGGFPTLAQHETTQIVSARIDAPERRRITVCGTILLKPGIAECRDVLLFRDPA